MCEAKPGVRCASDTCDRADDTAAHYRAVHGLDAPPVNPLAAAEARLTEQQARGPYVRTEPLTGDQVRALVGAGRRDFARASLAGADLSGADLSGVDLTEADLVRANLSGATLTGATLERARLEHAAHTLETVWPEGWGNRQVESRTGKPIHPRVAPDDDPNRKADPSVGEKRGVCGQCGERRVVRVASRKRGGSYNRAGRMYPTNICQSCAYRLLDAVQPGQLTTAQWDKFALRVWLPKDER